GGSEPLRRAPPVCRRNAGRTCARSRRPRRRSRPRASGRTRARRTTSALLPGAVRGCPAATDPWEQRTLLLTVTDIIDTLMTVTDIRTFGGGVPMRVFVTGASGWIGSAVVPELVAAGHEVVGLARSHASADRLEAAGVIVHRGNLDDPDDLAKAAADSDGVIHLAFQHDVAFDQGNFGAAADTDRRAVEAMGAALTGSDRPFVLASGMVGLSLGRVAT